MGSQGTNTFKVRKEALLTQIASGCDASSIGQIDSLVVPLCQTINSMDEFITTSSCSGRISVYWEGLNDKKRSGEWLLVSHEKVDSSNIIQSIGEIPQGEGMTFFRFEGFVLHLEANNLENAKKILQVGLACGFKNSGIVVGKRFIVGIRGTIKLDSPITKDGKYIVSNEYVQLLADLSNSKFEENQKRIDSFHEGVNQLKLSNQIPVNLSQPKEKGQYVKARKKGKSKKEEGEEVNSDNQYISEENLDFFQEPIPE